MPRLISQAKLGTNSRDLLLLALLGALLTLPLYLNPWLRVRSDALVHIGIVNAVGRGGLPPANPFLAGTGLAYYWGYDALIWGLHRLTGAGIDLLLALLNTLAAATLPPLLYLGARAAGGSRRGGYLAAALGILGLNGLGWLGLLGKDLSQSLKGVFPYLRAVSPPGGRVTLGFLTGKFLVATSVGPGLAGYAVSALLLEKAKSSRWVIPGLIAGAALAATAFLNLFAGAAAAGGALLYALAAGAKGATRGGGRGPALAGAIGVLALLGSMWLFTGGAGGAKPRLGFPYPADLRLLAAVLIPFWAALAAGKRERENGLAWALGAAAAGACLLLKLPSGNQYKFFFPLALQLAILAGERLGEGRARARAAGLIVLLCLPTTVLGLAAYGRDGGPRRPPADLGRLADSARDLLPRNAIVASGRLEWAVPVLLDRDAYLAREDFLRNLTIYRRELGRRKAQIRQALDPIRRAEVLGEISRETGRPVYWLGETPEAGPGMEAVISEGPFLLARPRQN